MSEPIICEFCGSKSKNKNLLLIHHKGAAKCIKMQIEKLGKPLYEDSKKKVEDSKKTVKKQPVKEEEEDSSEEDSSEEDQNQEIPFSSSDEESELDIQISEDESPKEDSDKEDEPIKSKFSSGKLFKNRNRTPSPKKEEFKEPPRVPLNNPLPLNQRSAPVNKLQELVNQRMAIANKNPRQEPPKQEVVKENVQEPIKEPEPKKSLKHPELMTSLVHEPKQEITKPQLNPPSINNKEIEAKLSLILNTLSSKDNKTVEEIKRLKEELNMRDEEYKQRDDLKNKGIIEEIKKLREELKARDEEAKNRNETIIKSIGKLEKVIDECNPSAMVEIIKKIQAEVESKEELLQIFKEDLDETCEKYYELYKKLKDVKYDMEEMVYKKK
jgi:hypothetical protein